MVSIKISNSGIFYYLKIAMQEKETRTAFPNIRFPKNRYTSKKITIYYIKSKLRLFPLSHLSISERKKCILFEKMSICILKMIFVWFILNVVKNVIKANQFLHLASNDFFNTIGHL